MNLIRNVLYVVKIHLMQF